MPAFYCGIFGHKPTSYLINTRGLTKRTGLEKHTIMCAGPMARHAEDLIPTLKVLIGPNISKLRLDDNVNVTTLNYFYACESHSPAVSAMSSEMKEIMIKTVNHFESLKDGEAVHNLELEEFRYSHRLWRYWMTQEGVDFAREITDGQGKANAFTELFKKLCGTSDYTLAAILKLFYDIMPGEKEQWAKTTTAKLKEALIVSRSMIGSAFAKVLKLILIFRKNWATMGCCCTRLTRGRPATIIRLSCDRSISATGAFSMCCSCLRRRCPSVSAKMVCPLDCRLWRPRTTTTCASQLRGTYNKSLVATYHHSKPLKHCILN